jgi:hypothetical protein
VVLVAATALPWARLPLPGAHAGPEVGGVDVVGTADVRGDEVLGGEVLGGAVGPVVDGTPPLVQMGVGHWPLQNGGFTFQPELPPRSVIWKLPPTQL